MRHQHRRGVEYDPDCYACRAEEANKVTDETCESSIKQRMRCCDCGSENIETVCSPEEQAFWESVMTLKSCSE